MFHPRHIRLRLQLVIACITQAMASNSSNFYLLHYQYTPDIMEKRGPHRDAHIGAARQQVLLRPLMCDAPVLQPFWPAATCL